MDKREYAHRVVEARRLLDEPLLNEALDKIEKAAIEALIAAPVWEPDWDHRRHQMLADRVVVIRSMRQMIEQTITTGEATLSPPRRVA
jgi:hypothetical protein